MHTSSTVSPDAPLASPTAQTLQRVQLTRLAAVACTLALLALGLAWELWLAPLRPGGSWWAIKVLPLAIPLGGLLKNRMYTYRWLSLAVWLYLIEGLVRSTTESGLSAWLAVAECVLCVALFMACALHVRLRLKAAKAQVPGVATTAAAD